MPLRDLIPAPAIEAIHGVTVVDPYRWLEDRTSAETQQWLEEQKHAHDRYFGGIRGIDVLRSRISEYLNIDAIDQPAIAGVTAKRTESRLASASRISPQEQYEFSSILLSRGRLFQSRFTASRETANCLLMASDTQSTANEVLAHVQSRNPLYSPSGTERVTLRLNEYGSSEPATQPLPLAFASFVSRAISVERMESVTSHLDVSRVLAPIVLRYSGTAVASTSTFPDPAQWRSSPFFFTPETQKDSPVSIST